MEWDKNDIVFQGQLVQFRNGLNAIAINSKTSDKDHDGSRGFFIYDYNTKNFSEFKNLDCYSDDLKCELSMESILNHIGSKLADPSKEEDLHDSEWDVVKQARWFPTEAAFRYLISGKIPWLWTRK